MTGFDDILGKLVEMQELTGDEAGFALQEMMEGRVNNSQIASFLSLLKAKGETPDEIAAFAMRMKKSAITISPKSANLVDTCGTGGDGRGTFNISTCSAIVAAGAGAVIAKHGNRSSSSRSGSADVLEELGVSIICGRETAERQIDSIGLAFLFAPSFHPAMRNVADVRRELGFRTVFNMLGPLTNPGNAQRQLIGVPSSSLMEKMGKAVVKLGTEKTILATSDIDEISISSQTLICEITGSRTESYIITPEEFGFKRARIEGICAGSCRESAGIILNVLKGGLGPARDVVLLNAGASIYVGGIASSIKQGISMAEKSIGSGRAMEKLDLLRDSDGHT
ncbi:anthranilate phosphoribosyltransferase [Candidatus Woesearchaeota archaeon]|nr:anthranilate phosphoribosyltransferase [Candidatus Woesearchaeota archaeon]